jgi:hypothetical protein
MRCMIVRFKKWLFFYVKWAISQLYHDQYKKCDNSCIVRVELTFHIASSLKQLSEDRFVFNPTTISLCTFTVETTIIHNSVLIDTRGK